MSVCRVAIFTIGTELTRGELVDSNAAWISALLTERGFSIVEHVTVADDDAAMETALRRLSASYDLVLTTGGLGPTSDDRTTAMVARVAGVDLVRDDATYRKLREFFMKRGREWIEANAKQADFPDGATILNNPNGTAPGFLLRLNEKIIASMPGVPREMKPMMRDEVWPHIAELSSGVENVLRLNVFGLPESELAQRLGDLEESGITIGYRVSFPEVVLRFSADDANVDLRWVFDKAKRRLCRHVFSEGDKTFSEAIGDALRARDWKLAIAESCSGGEAAKIITECPGSSDYFVASVVTCANSAKEQVLGVRAATLSTFGAVSEETVREMVAGALRLGESDIAIATSGIAGPGDGTDDKPVGTVWLACQHRDDEQAKTRKIYFAGSRTQNQRLASYAALDLVRRRALNVV